MPTHEYKVAMSCGGCSGAVEKVLGKLGKSIEQVKINLKEQQVLVTTNLSPNEILEVIKKSGKEVEFIKTL